MKSWMNRSGNRVEGLFHRPGAPLVLAIAGPVVVVGLLLLIPAVRDFFRTNPYLVSTVITAVAIAAIVVAFRSIIRRSRQHDHALEAARGQWAATRGWQYTPDERFIQPDGLGEVDSRLRPEPIPVKFEASGTFQGRRAFVHSRDTWVRFRATIGKARREVVGVESPVVLPTTVIERGGTSRHVRTITDRAERDRQRKAEGLTSVPGHDGAGADLWCSPEFRSYLPVVLGPLLQSIRQVFGTEQVIIACHGQWVLISVPDGSLTDRIDERLTYAAHVADALERDASPA